MRQFKISLGTSHLLWQLILLHAIFFYANSVNASPSTIGQSGLVNMPDARIAKEGTWSTGLSRFRPYSVLWSSIAIFSRLEFSARYTSVSNVAVFEDRPDGDFGDLKDKSFDSKLMLLQEGDLTPQISIGAQDFLGTQLFKAKFISLSKSLGDFDVSIGYGEARIDGVFGGIHYRPKWLGNWSFVAEYDAYDYKNDKSAQQSGADRRSGKGTYAVEYHWGWLGAQLSLQDSDVGINAYLSVPLMQKEFIPKYDEPKPYTTVSTRPSTQQWREDASVQAGLRRALERQGFKNVSLAMQQSQLQLGIATARISLIGRAVGRAVRTALLMAPQGVQSIQVNYYTLSDLPVVSYQFDDLIQLENFFAGKVTYGQLLQSLTVRYISPQDVVSLETVVPPIASRDAAEPTPRPENAFKLEKNSDGHMISLTKTDQSLNSFLFTPVQIGLFFNDPSGAIKYDWFAKASYQHYFDRGWFLNTAARLTISENVSDVVQLSNSTLPHVRTDVAEYKRSKGVKLDNLTLNKYHQLGARLYARWSLGYYEEMFAGTGGQILYMPKTYPWAIDTSVDWLRQRDFDGGFTLQDYETVTALVNFHYRFQGVGVTLTARAGRFLAKDKGVRFEFARRFRSGFMLGAWYTRTDGEDITGPGSPGSPYFDKGIFIQIPLGSMLTRDSRAAPFASLSPWTRDVGQRVQAPSDLYTIMEETLLFDRPEHHLLTGFHD